MDEVASATAPRVRTRRWIIAAAGAAALHALVLVVLLAVSDTASSAQRTPPATQRRIDDLRDRATSIDVTLTFLPAAAASEPNATASRPVKPAAPNATHSQTPRAPAGAPALAAAQPAVTTTPTRGAESASVEPPRPPPLAHPSLAHEGGAGNHTANRGSASVLKQRRAYAAQIRARLEAHKRYPEAARRMGQRGIATLRLAITATGVVSATLASSSGSPLLDREAMAMAARAGRLPAPPGGALQIKVPVAFQ